MFGARQLGIRGPATGIKKLGLMTGPENGPSATPVSSWLGSVFLGNTLLAAPAITGAPASSTFLNGSELYPTTRAGLTMGTPVALASFAMSDSAGGDGYGYWYFGGNNEAFVANVPNGTRTIFALFGVNTGEAGKTCRIYNGNVGAGGGSFIYTQPSWTTADANHRADLAGNVWADAAAFGSMVGVPMTITNGKFSIYVNSDFHLNWVGWQ